MFFKFVVLVMSVVINEIIASIRITDIYENIVHTLVSIFGRSTFIVTLDQLVSGVMPNATVVGFCATRRELVDGKHRGFSQSLFRVIYGSGDSLWPFQAVGVCVLLPCFLCRVLAADSRIEAKTGRGMCEPNSDRSVQYFLWQPRCESDVELPT